MKNTLFRRSAGLAALLAITSLITRAQTMDVTHNNTKHVSAPSDFVSNRNNWGLFGILGVIAIAGLTKRNVPQKS